MNSRVTLFVIASASAALIPLTACNDGGANSNVPIYYGDAANGGGDATTGGDAVGSDAGAADAAADNGTPQPDVTNPGPDATIGQPDGGPPPNNGDCTYNTFYEAEKQFGSPQQGLTLYQATTSGTEPYDLFTIEFYGGQFGGATQAGSYPLDGINYADCGNCVLIRKNCSQASGCEKTFYADEGTLVVEEWEAGGNFKGYLDGVVAYEVTIDSTTYQSTRVPNGENWCLDGQQFSTTVPDGNPTNTVETEATCVEAGNGNLVGANVTNASYTNCLGETVNLHDNACGGTTQALWIMATAGWCTACESVLSQLASQHGGSLSREIVGQQTPGLDMLIVLGENQNGAAPNADYCSAYAAKNNLDPAMVVIDNNPAGVQIPLIQPAGYAVEANGLATTWTTINPYLVADGNGSVQTGYPWMAVLRGSNMEYVWSDYYSSLGLNGAINEVLGGAPAAQ